MKRLGLLLVLLLTLSGCGPIIGQMMSSGEGVKSSELISGKAPTLKPGVSILVYGPFAKTANSFYICPGEEASRIADSLTSRGLRGELYLALKGTGRLGLAEVKKLTPEQMKSTLGLQSQPDFLLTGTLEVRQMNVAPSHGVIMEETYRLELTDLRSGAVSQFRISVKDLAQETTGQVVGALLTKTGMSR